MLNDTDIFPVPNIFDTDTSTFFDTKFFRYQFWDYFSDIKIYPYRFQDLPRFWNNSLEKYSLESVKKFMKKLVKKSV